MNKDLQDIQNEFTTCSDLDSNDPLDEITGRRYYTAFDPFTDRVLYRLHGTNLWESYDSCLARARRMETARRARTMGGKR